MQPPRPPRSGFSHKKEWVFLLFLSWWTSDLPNDDAGDLLDRY
jgi:hypothetical protein